MQPMQQADIEQAGLISEDERSRKQQEVFEEESAEVQVVKWDNFRLPIPVDHATFMRKVFLCLTCQLIVTAGVLAICVYVEEVRDWLLINYWVYWIGIGGVVCILCALMVNVENHPINIVLLCVFTLFMSFMVGTLCAAYAVGYGPDLVMQAFLITILVFIGLALFSCQTKCNLMPLGLLAFMLLNALMWWSLFAWIWGWYDSSWMSLMFVIVFCLYILFDVWRMCNMPVFNPSAWIPAAINLYLDIINLFLWILRLMAQSQN
mmetsp:Transcript_12989/g.20636  ORF Transcript_12989/g.20636 Transcript_12989/m.20636 type:complete len:263 (+) Transcript_12989:59-847(+)|eukprot:CAMPEP_0197036488 /NCGR_PEP_ID=MMETSP1384-20130603/13974_1 /TAXON_ID=29189 /ORGANISM="Ammonia sp." /LENGTH=262 /DNA_ID=CAMNT_0042466671 /DNA_START=28 /DNA_END=816 /DNA_ORIENTATION=+